jgi:hypothetical protein
MNRRRRLRKKEEAMTHAAESTPTQLPFTEAEWANLQRDDIKAGGTVVSLMASIFTIGLVLYLCVLWSVLA